MTTPTLKAIKIDDIQDVRSAVVEALDKLQKIRTISEETFWRECYKNINNCENEHYESERLLNKELNEIFQSLTHAEFWTWKRIRELEAA